MRTEEEKQKFYWSFKLKSEKMIHTRERVRKDSSKEKERLVSYTQM